MKKTFILRYVTVVLSLVMGVGLSVVGGAAPAGAAGPPITGSGDIYCTMTAGSFNFKPALTLGSTATTRVKVSASASHCQGVGDGATVTSVKVRGTLSGTQDGACGNSSGFGFSLAGDLSFSYKVSRGAPKLLPTTVTGLDVASFTTTSPIFVQVEGDSASGSFGGLPDNFVELGITQASECSALWTSNGDGVIAVGFA